MRRSALLIVFLLWAIMICQGQGKEQSPRYMVDAPGTSQIVVARVGPIEITAQQFMLSYEFAPPFARRSEDSRRRYLDFMINEKLLALDGYSRSSQTLPLISATVAQIEGDLATEEMYKDDIQKKVNVRDAEVVAGIEDSRQHVILRWIHAHDRNAIDRIAGQLHSGATFDSLYHLQGPDSVLNSDRYLESDLFKLKLKNRQIAAVAEKLRAGVVSRPVQGPDGWYLFRLVSRSRDMVVTESQVNQLRNDVQRALFQDRADSISEVYINRIMTDNKPVIQKAAFERLSEVLHARFGGADSAAGNLRRLDPWKELVLVSLSGKGAISLKEFLLWYETREANVSLSTRTNAAFEYSLKQLVWRMVRDRLLVDRAYKRGYQEKLTVGIQKKWWEEKLMYEAEKRLITDSIRWNDNDLRAFFEEHRRSYKNSIDGSPQTFEQAKDDVLRDYYQIQLNRRIFSRLANLKKRYPVSVREDILKTIPLEENEPKAVSVYAVKKGGTFPRPAFPTIDEQWRGWN